MYSQSATTDGYRQDCSGFVSMAHSLSKPGATTHTLSSSFYTISKDRLSPGDILLSSGHVVLFGGWTNSGKTRYWCYEESSYGNPARKRDTPYPYWSGAYTPMRRNGC